MGRLHGKAAGISGAEAIACDITKEEDLAALAPEGRRGGRPSCREPGRSLRRSPRDCQQSVRKW